MTEDRASLGARFADEIASLDREIGEIEMLITQASAEAGRHEQRRAAAADKAAGLSGPELAELNAQLLNLTKRAALMEAQVDVLEGKRKALARFRDAVSGYAATVADGGGLPEAAGDAVVADHGADGDASASKKARGGRRAAEADATELPPAVSRLVLTAQEDLRREIARAMHDGPAQSLTNIVLQAQIVERILSRNPAAALGEVHLLVAMVQQTLEATKSFIFDIRPMVLDDLGLVPTLRRATRERGRRTGVAVEFETVGADRRLAVDVESGLFRILDESLAAFLSAGAERVSLRLDWVDDLEARVVAGRGPLPTAEAAAATTPSEGRGRGRGKRDKEAEMPPALAAMVEERREAAREAAREATTISLPPATWREIQQRASTIGARLDLADDGSVLHLALALETAAGAAS